MSTVRINNGPAMAPQSSNILISDSVFVCILPPPRGSALCCWLDWWERSTMRILSFDQARLRGHPSAGHKQMLDQELRQPRLIALRRPALFHDQHAIEIIAGQRPQYVSRFLKRQARTQCSLLAQGGNQPGLVLTSPR